jgi:hypothetical protein
MCSAEALLVAASEYRLNGCGVRIISEIIKERQR